MKNWLLPHYCKKIGQALILLMLILIVASIYIEASFIDSNPWLMDAAQAALYIAIALISISREKEEDEMTAALRGKALKEVGYCVVIIYAVCHIIELMAGGSSSMLHDEQYITPFLVWIVYYGRFERHLRRLRKREFTL